MQLLGNTAQRLRRRYAVRRSLCGVAFSTSVGFICKNEKGTSDFSKVPVLLGWEMGFEPTVFGTTIRRFNQLSYTHHRCILKKNLSIN